MNRQEISEWIERENDKTIKFVWLLVFFVVLFVGGIGFILIQNIILPLSSLFSGFMIGIIKTIKIKYG